MAMVMGQVHSLAVEQVEHRPGPQQRNVDVPSRFPLLTPAPGGICVNAEV
jgi:hypothetical protein